MPAVSEERLSIPPAGDALAGAPTLDARGWLPADATDVVVLAHPHPLFGGTMDNKVIDFFGRRLRDEGVATLRFDFRGTRASTGEHDRGQGERDDVRAALRVAAERCPRARRHLLGFSFGSYVGSRAVVEDPALDEGWMILVGPPLGKYDFSDEVHGFDHLMGRRAPVVLLAGERDEYCPTAELRDLAGRIGDNAQAVVVDDANHLLDRKVFKAWTQLRPLLDGLVAPDGTVTRDRLVTP